ncbi:MAG: 2-oxoacid:ferredoxin oxidoreductase subunit beta [Rhodothermus marinus]
MSDSKRPEENTPRGTRPAMPPGAKPAMPPGAKPAMPPGAGPAMPPRSKPAMPPGAKPAGDGKPRLTRKDFASDQDVRWCPGCGDYAILATVQRLLPELDVPRENIVFISGIGCSSRFPYYMNTYGMHSIHGRAPAIATGLKASRPELDVWIITGDGDALSIGGNHLIHILRRNLNVQILLFNNQIYGLTKGQYSPTSEEGKITKSSPYGSIDHPFNPVALALGADATFVARSMDRDTKHLQEMLRRAHDHRGAAFVEIYQNCNIFNDGAFFQFTERDTKPHRALFLEHGKPLVFDEGRKGIRLDGFRPEVIDLTDGRWSLDDCLVYDETNRELAHIMARIFFRPDLPQPFGVFYREERPTYEDLLHRQIAEVTARKGKGDLQALLQSGDTWVIEPEPAEATE